MGEGLGCRGGYALQTKHCELNCNIGVLVTPPERTLNDRLLALAPRVSSGAAALRTGRNDIVRELMEGELAQGRRYDENETVKKIGRYASK